MLSTRPEVLTTVLTSLSVEAPSPVTYIEYVNGDQAVALPHERVSRRVALQASAAGAVGLTALVLPRAASASSVGVSSESTVAATTTTIASVESLSIHLDAGNVSAIRTILGTTRLYGWRSLSTDAQNYKLLIGRDVLNYLAVEGARLLEPYVFATIDGRAVLELACENVTDVDYRVHGSGSNGLGRNFIVGMAVTF